MTADEALTYALGQRLAQSALWTSTSNGLFYFQALAGIDLPYTTYVFSAVTPTGALQNTRTWRIRVQVKHWSDSVNMTLGPGTVEQLAGETAKLFHCRNDAGIGSSITNLDELNALDLNGWRFIDSVILKGIPVYRDIVKGSGGDVAVWCKGHDFLMELQSENYGA